MKANQIKLTDMRHTALTTTCDINTERVTTTPVIVIVNREINRLDAVPAQEMCTADYEYQRDNDKLITTVYVTHSRDCNMYNVEIAALDTCVEAGFASRGDIQYSYTR